MADSHNFPKVHSQDITFPTVSVPDKQENQVRAMRASMVSSAARVAGADAGGYYGKVQVPQDKRSEKIILR